MSDMESRIAEQEDKMERERKRRNLAQAKLELRVMHLEARLRNVEDSRITRAEALRVSQEILERAEDERNGWPLGFYDRAERLKLSAKETSQDIARLMDLIFKVPALVNMNPTFRKTDGRDACVFCGDYPHYADCPFMVLKEAWIAINREENDE